jgi:competence protein ComEC
VVVSAGRRNRYRFPHPEVTARYHLLSAQVVRTDVSGAVSVSTDGTDLQMRSTIRSDNK